MADSVMMNSVTRTNVQWPTTKRQTNVALAKRYRNAISGIHEIAGHNHNFGYGQPVRNDRGNTEHGRIGPGNHRHRRTEVKRRPTSPAAGITAI